jgi:hypothetical protein
MATNQANAEAVALQVQQVKTEQQRAEELKKFNLDLINSIIKDIYKNIDGNKIFISANIYRHIKNTLSLFNSIFIMNENEKILFINKAFNIPNNNNRNKFYFYYYNKLDNNKNKIIKIGTKKIKICTPNLQTYRNTAGEQGRTYNTYKAIYINSNKNFIIPEHHLIYMINNNIDNINILKNNVIDHINDKADDNRAENLQQLTQKENIKKGREKRRALINRLLEEIAEPKRDEEKIKY